MKPFTDQVFLRAGLALLVLAITACSSAPARRSVASKPVSAPVVAEAKARPNLAPVAGKPEADVRFKNALLLMQNHRPQEAQQAFQSLLKDYPDLSGALTDIGILYARSKQRDLALTSFTRAIEANPENAVALNWCGALYREAGDFRRAEQSWQRALEVRPEYAAAALNLAILYDVSMHRPQDALVRYRRYQQLAGQGDLIVTAWIKDLESRGNGVVVALAGGAP